MDPALLNSIGQLGLGGIVFVIWYFDGKKIEGYKDMVQQLLELAKQSRDERGQLVKIIGDQSTIMERTAAILSRVEGKMRK